MIESKTQIIEGLEERWRTLGFDLEQVETLTDARGVATLPECPMVDAFAPSERMLETLEPLRDLKIRRLLGEGGMGVVHAAEQTTFGREVAIKSIRQDRRDATSSKELLREAWITGQLEHPNIIPVHALGVDEGGVPLFVMKRVDGVSLYDVLEDPSSLPEYYGAPDASGMLEVYLDVFEQVCRAAHFAHQRDILHRDIKPDNVMLGTFGEVYLVDWGIALSLDPQNVSGLPSPKDVDQPTGTPNFMAPEMVGIQTHLFGPRTDVYLLGAMLHFILTGQPRHSGNAVSAVLLNAYASNPYEYGPEVPARLGEVCNLATHKDPEMRFASAQALRHAIVEYRRHRASVQVTHHAIAPLDELRAYSARADTLSEEDLAQSYQHFGECSFGFREALQIWPDNEDAFALQRDALLALIEIEFAHRKPAAVTSLLERLDVIPPELVSRLETLRQELATEREHVATLERRNRESDPRIGRRQRGVTLLALAGVLLLGKLSHWWATANAIELPPWMFSVGFKALETVMMIMVIFITRHIIYLNRVAKGILYSFGFLTATSVCMRAVGTSMGLTLSQCAAFEQILYAFFLFGFAYFIDRRLAFASPLCLFAALGSAFIPGFPWGVRVGINVLTLLIVGVSWIYGRSARGDTEPSSTALHHI